MAQADNNIDGEEEYFEKFTKLPRINKSVHYKKGLTELKRKYPKKPKNPFKLDHAGTVFNSPVAGEQVVQDWFIKRGWEVSRRGWPDLVAIDWDGARIRFVEVKGLTEPLRPEQRHMQQIFELAGLNFEIARVGLKDGKLQVETIGPEAITYFPRKNKA